jgi:radical SAM protein with 4Fe4S-binding SPASM domain
MVMPKNRWCSVFNPHKLTIDPNGDIYACDAVISNVSYRLASINCYDELIIKQKTDGVVNQLSETCKECKKLPICLGTCYIIKNEYNKNACFCTDNEIDKFLNYMLAKTQEDLNV